MGFRLLNVAGRAALVAGEVYFDLETVGHGAWSSCPMAAIERFEELHDVDLSSAQMSGESSGQVEDADLRAPVPRPGKVFGIGLNYRAHARESNMDIPEVPLVFAKFPNCICGPHDDIVLRGDRCDYEGEMVVVIGKEGKDIDEADAWDYVAGLTCGNDVSDRKVQTTGKPPQFNLGKSFDTFGPIGPAVVSPDLLPDREALALRCSISGEERQDSNTSDLIFPVATLVSYLSWITRLFPGDLIFTGTPSGVGAAHGTFLAEGDVIATSVEGIGQMRNRCVRG